MASNNDDWSEISDPKTRKRLQNRLAQRNYRKNLRTRIEELERQLAERSTADAQRKIPSQPINSPVSMMSSDISPFSQIDYMVLGPTPCQGLPSLLSSHSNNSTQKDPLMTSNNKVDGNLTPDETRRRAEPSSTEVPLPQHHDSDTRSLDIMYTMEWDTNYVSSDGSVSSNVESSQVDSRKPELLESDIEPLKEHDVNHLESGVRLLKDNASLTERLEYVLETIHRLGLDGLDSVISKYYTSDFRPSPRLASSQHLSRNRKLPAILSDLRASAISWTEWEAQGYKGEIVRSAEGILAAERKKLVEPPMLQQFMEKYEIYNLPENSKGDDPESAFLIASFQREAPYLWTLVSSLTTENGYAETQEDVQQALALMLILCCSGSTSRGKLYEMLKRCLGDML